MTTIDYQLSLHSPQAHQFAITCTIPKPDKSGQQLALPTWIPGSYLVRDFARHVVSISASCGKQAVAITKVNKHTWRCTPFDGPLVVRYIVYAYEISVRAAYFDTTRAYFNGTSVFLRVLGQENSTHRLHVAPFAKWHVATALPAEKTDKHGFGSYLAQDYTQLIDCPVEIGNFAVAEFNACGVPHRLVVSGRHSADLQHISRDLKRICEHHINFFGKPAPFERYDFLLFAAGEDQYGGLEHSNSTSLICPRHWLPSKDGHVDQENYADFLGLCSHEYFHAWHVKRIRPQTFKDADNDLDSEAYTRLLWVFEGFTAYYDSLALARCGLISRQQYLEHLGRDITRLLRTPGRGMQTLEDSSFDAWIKLYRPDENSPNAQVSYYLKGSLAALALDLQLRTSGKGSLDDIMHLLWQRHGKTGDGLPEDGMETLLKEIGGSGAVKLLKLAVSDTGELPLAKLLAKFGVSHQLRAATSDSDKGGKANGTKTTRHVLGVKLASGKEAKLAQVFSGGAAEQAGLAGGDVIVAVNCLKASSANLEKLVNGAAAKALHVHAFRRDELMEFEVTPQAAPLDTSYFTLQAKPSKAMVALLDGWLEKTAT